MEGDTGPHSGKTEIPYIQLREKEGTYQKLPPGPARTLPPTPGLRIRPARVKETGGAQSPGGAGFPPALLPLFLLTVPRGFCFQMVSPLFSVDVSTYLSYLH